MSARASHITLIGNVGAVPEFKHRQGENPYCVFTMAVDRQPVRGEEREPLWYRVTLWGKQAENAVKKGYKGQPVYVAGRFDVSEWTDGDGRGRFTLEVAANDFQMLAFREQAGDKAGEAPGARGGRGGAGAARPARKSDAAPASASDPAEDY